jgi:hypothetical protein
VLRGVYAVGRPEVSQLGRWMAAVLACGTEAVLSHRSAAALWGLIPLEEVAVEVSVPPDSSARASGVRVHRRQPIPSHLTRHQRIPVTTPARTLVDIACGLRPAQVERAVNEADRLDLIDPEALRRWIVTCPPMRGLGVLRRTLDVHTFTLTASELERRFLPLARRAGLPMPETGSWVNGFKVDFYWPDFGLVVETDGLRHHRTPAQQARDRLRDQAHQAAGLTPVRFTRAQVAYEPQHVLSILRDVVAHLPRVGAGG